VQVWVRVMHACKGSGLPSVRWLARMAQRARTAATQGCGSRRSNSRLLLVEVAAASMPGPPTHLPTSHPTHHPPTSPPPTKPKLPTYRASSDLMRPMHKPHSVHSPPSLPGMSGAVQTASGTRAASRRQGACRILQVPRCYSCAHAHPAPVPTSIQLPTRLSHPASQNKSTPHHPSILDTSAFRKF